jgi:hypothetical protein
MWFLTTTPISIRRVEARIFASTLIYTVPGGGDSREADEVVSQLEEGCFGFYVHIFPLYLIYFDMLKKFKRKNRTYVFTCCMCTKSFHEKSACRLVYVKKIYFDAKKRYFMVYVLSFYTDHMQCHFFAKLYERI